MLHQPCRLLKHMDLLNPSQLPQLNTMLHNKTPMDLHKPLLFKIHMALLKPLSTVLHNPHIQQQLLQHTVPLNSQLMQLQQCHPTSHPNRIPMVHPRPQLNLFTPHLSNPHIPLLNNQHMELLNRTLMEPQKQLCRLPTAPRNHSKTLMEPLKLLQCMLHPNRKLMVRPRLSQSMELELCQPTMNLPRRPMEHLLPQHMKLLFNQLMMPLHL